jgi:hypothetical protein
MHIRPVIFLSAVSRELRSARQSVANCLHALGYDADWQDVFDTGSGDLLQMLRGKIERAQAVIQIIGRCYGAEPREPTPEFGRVSYTQYEALYAGRLGKKVYYITLGEEFPADAHEPESDELRALQTAYMEKVRSTGDLYHPAHSAAELENKILRLRDELAALRRRVFRWAAVLAGLICATAAGVFWMLHSQSEHGGKVDELARRHSLMEQAFRRLADAERRVRPMDATLEPADRRAAAYALIEQELQLPAGTLAKELPGFARELYESAGSGQLEKARAAYALEKYDDAERWFLEYLNTAGGASNPARLEALQGAGRSAAAQNRHADALRHFTAAEPLTDKTRDYAAWFEVQWDIALSLYHSGQYAASARLWDELVRTHGALHGPEHEDTVGARFYLALALSAAGETAAAGREYRTLLAHHTMVFGPEDPQTLRVRNNFATVLGNEGRFAESEREYRAVLDIRRRVLGPEDAETLGSRINVARCLEQQGRAEEAAAELRDTIGILTRVCGPEHAYTLGARFALAGALDEGDRHAEAEAEFRELLAIRQRVDGAGHPDTLNIRGNLANVMAKQNRNREAADEYRAVIDGQMRALGPEHPDTLNSRTNLAYILRELGGPEDAEAELRGVLAIRLRLQGADHPDVSHTRVHLALALRDQGKIGAARAEAAAGLRGTEAAFGGAHPKTALARQLVAELDAIP